MRRLLAGSLLLLLILTGCEKNKLAKNTGSTLDSVVIYSPAGNKILGTTKYQYNSIGSISRLTTSGNSTIYTYDFSYNTQGKLLSVQSNIDALPLFLDSMVYNAAGNIVKRINKALRSNFGTSDHAFAYDTQGHLLSDSIYNSSYYGPYLSEYYAFEYNNGNLISAKHYGTGTRTGPLTLIGTETYRFDDRVNPFNRINIPLFMSGVISASDLSQNNLLSITFTDNSNGTTTDGQIIKSITYFDNDLPRTIVHKGYNTANDTQYEYFYK